MPIRVSLFLSCGSALFNSPNFNVLLQPFGTIQPQKPGSHGKLTLVVTSVKEMEEVCHFGWKQSFCQRSVKKKKTLPVDFVERLPNKREILEQCFPTYSEQRYLFHTGKISQNTTYQNDSQKARRINYVLSVTAFWPLVSSEKKSISGRKRTHFGRVFSPQRKRTLLSGCTTSR